MSKKQVVFFLSVVFLGLEIISQIAFSIIPLEVHQRFESSLGRSYNGLGAHGGLYMGQPIRIAVFGSCIGEMRNLESKDTWTFILQQKYGTKNVHIDNFSVGLLRHNSINRQIKELYRFNQRYDLAIVYFSVPPFRDAPLDVIYHHHYSSRWLREKNSPLVFPTLLGKWFTRRVSVEGWSDWLLSAQAKDIHSLNLRQSSRVKSSLTRFTYPLTESARKVIRRRINEIQSNLEKLSPRVFWMQEGLAYHSNMLPEIEDRYIMVKQVAGTDADPKYYDAYSLYDLTRNIADENIATLKARKIPYLDVGGMFSPRLQTENDLFIDELHFSSRGSKELARVTFETLNKEFPDLFRTESR